MASIFDGVPFITEIPGRRPPEDHARNLAVGVQLADVINRRRATERGQDREDRELTMRESYMQAQESQRDAHAKLLQARVDALAHETADQALMNENLPKLYENPSAFDVPPPFKTFNALEQWEKSRSLLEQRKLGIDRVKIAQGIDERLNKLGASGAALQARRMKEGFTPEVMAELGRLEAARPIVEGLSPNANTVRFAVDLRRRASALQAAGDAAGAASLLEEAAKLEATTARGQMSVTTNPDGTVTVTQGPAGAGTLGKASLQDQVDMRDTLNQVWSLRNMVRGQDLGVTGVVGELADKILPQFNLGNPDEQRTETRSRLNQLKQRILRQMSTDSRFNENDFKRIEKALPSGGILENDERARIMLDTIADVFSEREMRTLVEDSGNDMQKARIELIKRGPNLSPPEIKKAFQWGLLTRDEASSLLLPGATSTVVPMPTSP